MSESALVERPEDLTALAELEDNGEPVEAASVPPAGDGVEAPKAAAPPTLRADTLASSVAILLILSVLQRVFGFGRQVLVGHWLEKDQVGLWDLSFRFLMLAAPLAAFGVPGSFGRYLEHYRVRGHLKTFLRRTACACLLLAGVVVAAIVGLQSWMAELIFNDRAQTDMVVLLAVSLIAIIALNFLTDMFTALRMVRVTGHMQFWSTLAFGIFSIVLILFWRKDAVAIVVAYAVSCAGTFILALVWFRGHWQTIPDADDHLPHSKLWANFLPFAAWIWSVNLLYNLTGVVDRYMLMRFAPTAPGATEAQQEILRLELAGDYHTSQVVPLLMVSVCGILGGIIMPYLSRDWESGRKDVVSLKLNLTIKLLGLGMVAGSALTLLASPLLFGLLWHGKFTGGHAILPWTLTYCVWMGLIPLAQMYLWCAERPTRASLALAAGLIVNVALCWLLLPSYGLHAVAWASAAANLFSLTLIYYFNRVYGFRLDRGVLLVTLLPIAIGGGTAAAIVATIVAVAACMVTNQIFTAEEKSLMLDTCRRATGAWQGQAESAAAEVLVATTDTHTEL